MLASVVGTAVIEPRCAVGYAVCGLQRGKFRVADSQWTALLERKKTPDFAFPGYPPMGRFGRKVLLLCRRRGGMERFSGLQDSEAGNGRRTLDGWTLSTDSAWGDVPLELAFIPRLDISEVDFGIALRKIGGNAFACCIFALLPPVWRFIL